MPTGVVMGAFNAKTRLTGGLSGGEAKLVAEGVWVVQGQPARCNVYLIETGNASAVAIDFGSGEVAVLAEDLGLTITDVLMTHHHRDQAQGLPLAVDHGIRIHVPPVEVELFRDVEEMMAARGVLVSYETVRRWCDKFGKQYADGLRRRRARTGDKWHLDEVFLKINGVTHYLWRAVDQNGDVLDILVQPKRDRFAAIRFFRKLLRALGANRASLLLTSCAAMGRRNEW